MLITPAQCRAARSLLNWSQEELSHHAGVSRATVVDFEASNRAPIKNNLRSIADCLFAAGVELVPEEGSRGVGVRYYTRKITYIKSIKIDQFNDKATVPMQFAGEGFTCVIRLHAVDDYHRTDFSTDAEYVKAIEANFHLFVAVAERYAKTGIQNGELIITTNMLNV
ncbi:helix-turn-helix domain-containing protein [Aliiroseovarius sp.]|uniref:helix-turn-helix domain-containing protein n=1 Tax=Aliiroseovarius sp. TaxID=1872442 RepID=UPI003BAA75FF